MTNSHAPKYDSRVNPAYQIDWQHEQSGKKISATKRRIRFRYGFSNREAVEQGLSGTDCRGEEHEVLLLWSLTSGKRYVLADGHEVHFSKGKVSENMFETSWTISGGHIIKLIAHAASPLFNTPGFRQFDLQLDGLSFFEMPKIYELGTKKSTSKSRPAPIVTRESNFALPPSERSPPAEYRTPTYQAREYNENRRVSTSAPMPTSVTPDFASRPEPFQANAPVAQFTAPAQETAIVSPVYQQQSQWGQSPQAGYDEFAPSPPTYEDKSNQILNTYTPAKVHALPALTYAPHYSEYDSASPAATMTDVSDYDDSSHDTPDKNSPPVLKPTMAPISIAEMQGTKSAPVDEIERAFKCLVNLDDISHEVETPEQAKTARLMKEKKATKGKSRPVPPTAPEWNLGFNPSLGDIKEKAAPKQEQKKEIMKTHAFDPNAAQAGMLVVYGATQGFGQPAQQHGFGQPRQHHGYAQPAPHGMAALPAPPMHYHRAY